MKNALIVAGIVAMASPSGAQQTATQYVISTRILAGSPRQTREVEIVAAPIFRMPSGRTATVNLDEAAGGLRLAVTPSDLGAGKVALRVVAEAQNRGGVQASTFDLLAGSDASTPTVALRDGTGAFMSDKQGRPLFMEFETSIRR
jgi:hypothetical protein